MNSQLRLSCNRLLLLLLYFSVFSYSLLLIHIRQNIKNVLSITCISNLETHEKYFLILFYLYKFPLHLIFLGQCCFHFSRRFTLLALISSFNCIHKTLSNERIGCPPSSFQHTSQLCPTMERNWFPVGVG